MILNKPFFRIFACCKSCRSGDRYERVREKGKTIELCLPVSSKSLKSRHQIFKSVLNKKIQYRTFILREDQTTKVSLHKWSLFQMIAILYCIKIFYRMALMKLISIVQSLWRIKVSRSLCKLIQETKKAFDQVWRDIWDLEFLQLQKSKISL